MTIKKLQNLMMLQEGCNVVNQMGPEVSLSDPKKFYLLHPAVPHYTTVQIKHTWRVGESFSQSF